MLPKEFQHSETALNTLTCIQYVGIMLVCMKSFLEPLEESKAPSAKGAHYPSTESLLCK
ncbi:hypothetical protein ACE6H2_007755 [Prunus campanulata]